MTRRFGRNVGEKPQIDPTLTNNVNNLNPLKVKSGALIPNPIGINTPEQLGNLAKIERVNANLRRKNMVVKRITVGDGNNKRLGGNIKRLGGMKPVVSVNDKKSEIPIISNGKMKNELATKNEVPILSGNKFVIDDGTKLEIPVVNGNIRYSSYKDKVKDKLTWGLADKISDKAVSYLDYFMTTQTKPMLDKIRKGIFGETKWDENAKIWWHPAYWYDTYKTYDYAVPGKEAITNSFEKVGVSLADKIFSTLSFGILKPSTDVKV